MAALWEKKSSYVLCKNMLWSVATKSKDSILMVNHNLLVNLLSNSISRPWLISITISQVESTIIILILVVLQFVRGRIHMFMEREGSQTQGATWSWRWKHTRWIHWWRIVGSLRLLSCQLFWIWSSKAHDIFIQPYASSSWRGYKSFGVSWLFYYRLSRRRTYLLPCSGVTIW